MEVVVNEGNRSREKRKHKTLLWQWLSVEGYADDMVIFCGSKASAEQTLKHIVPFIEKKLFLKVNREKTVVAYAGKVKFLGYGFYKGKRGFALRVHAKSKAKMKARVRELTSRRTVTRIIISLFPSFIDDTIPKKTTNGSSVPQYEQIYSISGFGRTQFAPTDLYLLAENLPRLNSYQ